MKSNSAIIYMDQNALGHLITGQPAREELVAHINKWLDAGATFVFSDVHVEECRAYHAPTEYVKVLEEIDAAYLLPHTDNDVALTVQTHRANALITGEIDFAEQSQKMLDYLFGMIPFALGWMGEASQEDLIKEVEAELDEWLKSFERETLGLINTNHIRDEMLQVINSVDLNQRQTQKLPDHFKSPEALNRWYSKIDKQPPDQVADFIISQFDEDTKKHLRSEYPEGKWPTGPYSKFGNLIGLTMFLFTQGVGRDALVKRGRPTRRKKRFMSQVRDCRHIENAAQCHLFVTLDKRACDLATAAYKYAGAKTKILYLQIAS